MQGVDKALHHVDKSVSHEHKTASKLSAAEHKHNVALQEVTQSQKEVELRKRQQADLAADLARKRASVDEYQRRKEFNDVRSLSFIPHGPGTDARMIHSRSASASSPKSTLRPQTVTPAPVPWTLSVLLAPLVQQQLQAPLELVLDIPSHLPVLPVVQLLRDLIIA